MLPTQQQEPKQDAQQPTEQPKQSEMPKSFDEFLTAQPEEVRALYQEHTKKLQNAVAATRDERDTLKQQLVDLAKKAEGETKAKLEAMSAQLEITERRASFLEDAVKPEIECRNPGAAWVIAKAQDLFTKNGQPDWKAIKSAAPELFGKVIANANAGAGTGQPPAKQNSMNDFIRSRGRS